MTDKRDSAVHLHSTCPDLYRSVEGHVVAWLALARRRLDELRSGKVQAVPGEEVFERIRNRFGA